MTRLFRLAPLAILLAAPFLMGQTQCAPVDPNTVYTSLIVRNNTGILMSAMYMRPVDSNDWTPDQLGGTQLLGSGATQEVERIPAGVYDLKATFTVSGVIARTIKTANVTLEEGAYLWDIILNADDEVEAAFDPYTGQPIPIQVPDVIGLTRASAETTLRTSRLKTGTVTEEFNEVYASGTVIDQTPPSGTKVDKDSAVDLVISKGKAEQVLVPSLTGKTRAEAETSLAAVGLIIGTVTEEYSATVVAGKVLSQTPLSGVRVDQGSSVALVLSKGPEPKVAWDFIEALEPDTTLGGLVESDKAEQILVLGTKDDFGAVEDFNGGGYVDTLGHVFVYWNGDDGYPLYGVIEDWFFEFSNFTSTTFDAVATTPAGAAIALPGLKLDAAETTRALDPGVAPMKWGSDWQDAIKNVAQTLKKILPALTKNAKVLVQMECDDTAFFKTALGLFSGDSNVDLAIHSVTFSQNSVYAAKAQTAADQVATAIALRDQYAGNHLVDGTGRRLTFAGKSWWAIGAPGDPGQNSYDGSLDTVDERNGELKLRIRKQDTAWYCSSVTSANDSSDTDGWFATYGTHRFWIEGPIAALDKNIALSVGLHGASKGVTMDFFSPNGSVIPDNTDSSNAQFKVLPRVNKTDIKNTNWVPYGFALTGGQATLFLEWGEDSVRCAVYSGFISTEEGQSGALIEERSFTQTGVESVGDIPAEADSAAIVMSLWLADSKKGENPDGIGDPPSDGANFQLSVKDYGFAAPPEKPWYDGYDFAAKNVLGYWPFDTDVNDVTTNNNDPDNQGVALTAESAGRFKAGADLAAGDYLQFTTLDYGRSPATWAFWYKPRAIPTNGSKVFGYHGTGVDGNFIAFKCPENLFKDDDDVSVHNYIFSVVGPDPAQTLVSYVRPVLGRWYHIAMVIAPDKTELYVDGVLTDTEAGKSFRYLASPYLGNSQVSDTWGTPVNGIADDLVCFDRALTATEVSALSLDSNNNGRADFWE